MGLHTQEMIRWAKKYEKEVNGADYDDNYFMNNWRHLIRAYRNGLAEFKVGNNRMSLHDVERVEGAIYTIRMKDQATVQYECVNGQWEEVEASWIDDEIYY